VSQFTTCSYSPLSACLLVAVLLVPLLVIPRVVKQRRLALSVLVAERCSCPLVHKYFWPFWFGRRMGYYEMMLFPILRFVSVLSRSYCRLLVAHHSQLFPEPGVRSVPADR